MTTATITTFTMSNRGWVRVCNKNAVRKSSYHCLVWKHGKSEQQGFEHKYNFICKNKNFPIVSFNQNICLFTYYRYFIFNIFFKSKIYTIQNRDIYLYVCFFNFGINRFRRVELSFINTTTIEILPNNPY